MFQLAATRRGSHWALADAEKKAVGDALANVIRHVPLPERELGIAADIAALGFCFYAITVPRIELDKQLAAGAIPGAPRPPADLRVVPTPEPARPGEVPPGMIEDADALLRGLGDLTPETVAQLNALANGQASQPLIAEGDAVLGGRVEVQGDELGPHAPRPA